MATATAIRPLTLQERGKPAQLSFHGGFRNVSFQLGECMLPESSQANLNGTTASYVSASIKKSAKIQFPVMIPNSLTVLRGVVNIIATVVGQRNSSGGYDAILLARATERLSSFNTKLRTVEHLIESKAHTESQDNSIDDNDSRLGKSSNARAHNQVMLAGVVVGAKFEDGQFPRFHIFIRQDSNPNNIIPLCYEGRNANSMVARVKYGNIIYVDGEYVCRTVPVFQVDESGNRKLDAQGQPIPELDASGVQLRRMRTYIRITPPKDPAEFDLDLGDTVPGWMNEIAKKLADARTRSTNAPKQASTGEQAKTPNQTEDPRKTIFAGIPASVNDL